MHAFELKPDDRVLILGATGFIGRRLVRELAGRDIKLRLLVRNPSKASDMVKGRDIEIVQGDLMQKKGLSESLKCIHSAYYLVHSMGGSSINKNTEFAERDKKAARNFLTAAGATGLKRVIYLGGLGEKGKGLSEHLSSKRKFFHRVHRRQPCFVLHLLLERAGHRTKCYGTLLSGCP
jgi:uncharacterized protein YbjT (DUF2867 family)